MLRGGAGAKHVANRSAGTGDRMPGTGDLASSSSSGSEPKTWMDKLGVPAIVQRHLLLVVLLLAVLLVTVSRVAVQAIYEKYTATETSIGVVTKCSKARSGLGLDGLESSCGKGVTRILDYCNSHKVLPAGLEGPASPPPADTPNFAGAEQYEMEHLVLLVRHGDRSAIHEIPGAVPDSASDSGDGDGNAGTGGAVHAGLQHPLHGNKFLDVRALHYIPRLTSFAIRQLEGGTSSVAALPLLDASTEASPWSSGASRDSKSMFDALDNALLFQKGDLALPPGKLTSRGFMQHVLLGQALQRAYQRFLQQHVLTPKNVQVRSTNYDRTIQSVAALLLGLLPDVGGPDAPIDIHVFQDESAEVMHGITARCRAAVQEARREKGSFELPRDVQQRLVQLFGEEAGGTSITEVTDAALPRLCHNRQLPCGAGTATSGGSVAAGGQSCLAEEDLGVLMGHADRAFCGRYTGSSGGRASTRLNTFPFLQEVVAALQAGGISASASSAAATDVQRATRAKVTLFSGHDTVIAPVLEGLGLYEGVHCRWPQYASRIAFELWRKELGADKGRAGDGQLFVRVVYNGHDLTAAVPACKGANPCPLEALHEQVQALLRPARTLEDACRGV